MAGNGTVLGLVGSPNKEGRTSQLVAAALDGAAGAGARTELIYMADHVVAACKDCLPWECFSELKCKHDDAAFEYVSDKVLNCGALVLGTPVYWGDTSGVVKYFILKMFRVYARPASLSGLPTLGIAIAGGTGNGLVSGVRPLYHFFQVMQTRALEPIPATRFNFTVALGRAADLGSRLAQMADKRRPFGGLEERLMWYDALPYLGLSRADERKLLVNLITSVLPEGVSAALGQRLARADTLWAAHQQLEALIEVSRVYEAGVRAFEEL